MVAKTVKSSGKSVKQGAKTRASVQPVSKLAGKTAKKKATVAPGKKSPNVAKPAAKPTAKKPAAKKPAPKSAKPAPKKLVAKSPAKPPAKPAEKRAATGKHGASKAAIGKAAPASPKAAAVASRVPRHPQRGEAAPPPAASGVANARLAGEEERSASAPAVRPVSAMKPSPPARRPFSRESVRVGEARSAQVGGVRPVFPAEFLERQRERLQVKKLEILAMYQKDLRSGQESNDSPTEDLVDRANNAYTRELAFSISDSERELMHQIDLAIERLNSGAYGFCLHTGQQIGQARLEAIPWAKYSVEAQELLEKGLLSEA